MTTLKPSDFAKVRPMGSVLRKHEAEIVAWNIMIILADKGDVWRKLSHYEYRAEREMVGNFSLAEINFFNQVIDFCVSPETARLFSPEWKEIGK